MSPTHVAYPSAWLNLHPFTCAYCTGDGVTRPEWGVYEEYLQHMDTVHHGLPFEIEDESR